MKLLRGLVGLLCCGSLIFGGVSAQSEPTVEAETRLVNPLTGLPVDDSSVLQRRPLVVKISNAPPLVRPQAGLNAADIVWEHYAEAGLTRFSGIFYSQAPRRVGSIRSARLIDLELVPMYQAALVFSGTSVGVGELLSASAFFDRTYNGTTTYGVPYYYRDAEIPVPHNLFADLTEIQQLIEREGLQATPELEGMIFDPNPPPNPARTGNYLSIRYRGEFVEWRYDPDLMGYRRSSDGIGHFDGTTLLQVTAQNVVLLYAEHIVTDIIESGEGPNASRSIEIVLTGEGDAVLLRNGQAYLARWVRPTSDEMLILTDRAGDALPFNTGNTWFQVFPLIEQLDPSIESVVIN